MGVLTPRAAIDPNLPRPASRSLPVIFPFRFVLGASVLLAVTGPGVAPLAAAERAAKNRPELGVDRRVEPEPAAEFGGFRRRRLPVARRPLGRVPGGEPQQDKERHRDHQEGEHGLRRAINRAVNE